MEDPTSADIEEFIRKNDVDESAAKSLQECPPDLQRVVLSRGELSTARNPSAALLTRIRDARAGAAAGALGAKGPADVEEFIKTNSLDESAATSLRTAPADIQRAVLARGDLTTARNPSSAVLARIRDAKAGDPLGYNGGRDGRSGGGQPPPPAGPAPFGGWAGYGMYGGYGAPPPGFGMYPGYGPPGGFGGYPGGYGSGGFPGGAYGMYPPGCGMYPGGGAYGQAGGGAQNAYGMPMGGDQPMPGHPYGPGAQSVPPNHGRSRSKKRSRSSSTSRSRRDRRRRR